VRRAGGCPQRIPFAASVTAARASQLVGLSLELEIVKRTDKEGGFKILRRRWVIERTFSWLRRNRMAHYQVLVMSPLALPSSR